MPLIQQQKPKKLEVVQENNNSEDLPDINIRADAALLQMVSASREITPAMHCYKTPKPSTPLKFTS
jgi:hypothetical protein